MKFEHDFHIHTFYSGDADKNATVENYVKEARKLGLKKLGFAEHFWDDKIDGAFPFYRPLTFKNISRVKPEIDKYQSEDIKLYFGCEVEYNPVIKAPALTEEIAEKFDFILVPNSHSHETMPKEDYPDKQKHLDFVVDVFNNIVNCNLNKYITAMAHPFGLVRCPYPASDLIKMVSDDDFKKMFFNAAEKEIALEINIDSVISACGESADNFNKTQLFRMFKNAKDVGCKFIFGSDAHNINDLNKIKLYDKVEEHLELKKKIFCLLLDNVLIYYDNAV